MVIASKSVFQKKVHENEPALSLQKLFFDTTYMNITAITVQCVIEI